MCGVLSKPIKRFMTRRLQVWSLQKKESTYLLSYLLSYLLYIIMFDNIIFIIINLSRINTANRNVSECKNKRSIDLFKIYFYHCEFYTPCFSPWPVEYNYSICSSTWNISCEVLILHKILTYCKQLSNTILHTLEVHIDNL